MAKYWEHLKYNPDEVEKHKITQEEIKFLKDLQHEMNTQDNVGQADPRYWVIRDYEKIYGENLNNADGIFIYDTNSCETISEVDYQLFNVNRTIEEIIKNIKENGFELESDAIENIKSAYDMNSLVEILREIEEFNFAVGEYQEIPKETGFFLTQKAAETHLKDNNYHYGTNAHTYAHTAWRSKEEKLWDILQKVNFDLLN